MAASILSHHLQYYCNTLQLESVRELLFSTQFGYNMISFIAKEASIHDFESEKKQEFRLEKNFKVSNFVSYNHTIRIIPNKKRLMNGRCAVNITLILKKKKVVRKILLITMAKVYYIFSKRFDQTR